jgi:hypothetical protein
MLDRNVPDRRLQITSLAMQRRRSKAMPRAAPASLQVDRRKKSVDLNKIVRAIAAGYTYSDCDISQAYCTHAVTAAQHLQRQLFT